MNKEQSLKIIIREYISEMERAGIRFPLLWKVILLGKITDLKSVILDNLSNANSNDTLTKVQWNLSTKENKSHDEITRLWIIGFLICSGLVHGTNSISNTKDTVSDFFSI